MPDLTVAVVLYKGVNVPRWSQGIFDPSWVDKLYRGIERNIKDPFRFVCYVDDDYTFSEPVISKRLILPNRDMFSLLEVFRQEGRTLFMGLDTVIVGDITDIARYNGSFAMTRDPNNEKIGCSGVMAFPHCPHIWETLIADRDRWMNEYQMAKCPSDMLFLNRFPHEYLDDAFPGQIKSYKVHVKRQGLGDARIVYFHGRQKPHEIDEDFVRSHWW